MKFLYDTFSSLTMICSIWIGMLIFLIIIKTIFKHVLDSSLDIHAEATGLVYIGILCILSGIITMLIKGIAL